MSTLKHAVLVVGFGNRPTYFKYLHEAELCFKTRKNAMLGVGNEEAETFLPNQFMLDSNVVRPEVFLSDFKTQYGDYPHRLEYQSKTGEVIYSTLFDTRREAHDADDTICDFIAQTGIKDECKATTIILEIFNIAVA